MSERSDRPFDAGLQLERTALAWRRTCLALAAASIGAMRILPASLGPWSIVLGAVGLVLAAMVMWLSQRRYSTTHHRLTAEPPHPGSETIALHLLCISALFVLGGIALLAVTLNAVEHA